MTSNQFFYNFHPLSFHLNIFPNYAPLKIHHLIPHKPGRARASSSAIHKPPGISRSGRPEAIALRSSLYTVKWERPRSTAVFPALFTLIPGVMAAALHANGRRIRGMRMWNAERVETRTIWDWIVLRSQRST